MVGRLVEQEDVGLVDEGLGQQDPPLHARGERLEPGVGVEPHPGEDRLDPVVRAAEADWSSSSSPSATSSATVPAVALGDVLGQPGDPQALLADDLALVGLELAPDEPQQRALPLAVAAQQAEPLAPLDLQIDPIEQPGTAEGQADVSQAQQRHEISRLSCRETKIKTETIVRIQTPRGVRRGEMDAPWTIERVRRGPFRL